MSLETDIKQTKFRTPLQRLLLNIIYTGNWLMYHQMDLLRGSGLSPQQYNVLRILRGQAGNPIKLNDISCRMLDKTSNVSRLIDKLLEKGLVDRTICSNNRRAVDILITQSGLALLDKLDPEVEAWENLLATIPHEKAEELSTVLDKIRLVSLSAEPLA
jgi:DNA-binding MarR family transcriptional regulator